MPKKPPAELNEVRSALKDPGCSACAFPSLREDTLNALSASNVWIISVVPTDIPDLDEYG